MARGGHPLGLIECMIERVCQAFLPFELHKFGIFLNLQQIPGSLVKHGSEKRVFEKLGLEKHGLDMKLPTYSRSRFS